MKKQLANEQKHNPFAFKNNRRILTKDYKIKKKTELCSSYQETGACKYGNNCAFAHGEHELQKKVHVPSMYKTKLCQQFHTTGKCPYGHRCQFIHSENIGDLIKKDTNVKKQVSYAQMLRENATCLNDRIKSSHNPYLNEFNLVYKELIPRLPVFNEITCEPVQETVQDKMIQSLKMVESQYLDQEITIQM